MEITNRSLMSGTRKRANLERYLQKMPYFRRFSAPNKANNETKKKDKIYFDTQIGCACMLYERVQYPSTALHYKFSHYKGPTKK